MDLENKPLVSIVTVVFNGAEGIERTFESVKKQTYNNIEYIVIDGGSSDNTVDLIKENAEFISYWVSERDHGIGDAWNKGIAKATGDFICILNCGDTYEESFIYDNVVNYSMNSAEVLYGTTCLFDKDKMLAIVDNVFDVNKLENGFGFLHTSCFTSKKVYDLVGPFDKNISIAVDTDWLLRALNKGVKLKKIKSKNYMEIGGISDKKWKAAGFQYLECMVRHGFIKNSELYYLKNIVRLKSIYRDSGLMFLKAKLITLFNGNKNV